MHGPPGPFMPGPFMLWPRGMTPLKMAYEISNHHDFRLDFWFLNFDLWFPSWFLISKLISDIRIDFLFWKTLAPTRYKLLYYVPALVLVLKAKVVITYRKNLIYLSKASRSYESADCSLHGTDSDRGISITTVTSHLDLSSSTASRM